jgi:hypothetical protein
MNDFQRVSLDLAGLFLCILCFIAAVHFRLNAASACVLFFAAVAFFASLICSMVTGYPVAYKAAWFACLLSSLASAASFVLLFMMAVA